jgi:hypothetical protein
VGGRASGAPLESGVPRGRIPRGLRKVFRKCRKLFPQIPSRIFFLRNSGFAPLLLVGQLQIMFYYFINVESGGRWAVWAAQWEGENLGPSWIRRYPGGWFSASESSGAMVRPPRGSVAGVGGTARARESGGQDGTHLPGRPGDLRGSRPGSDLVPFAGPRGHVRCAMVAPRRAGVSVRRHLVLGRSTRGAGVCLKSEACGDACAADYVGTPFTPSVRGTERAGPLPVAWYRSPRHVTTRC